ncbi:MAG: DUF748 domain-containing protein, partial [Deltaproteobacteria bacterium]|nr:DUF748 domain-containing protein [Deltaproteobacteria bacterium]
GVTASEVGWLNESKEKPYRVYVSGADLTLSGLSTEAGSEPARAELKGRFMGSGEAAAVASFKPTGRGAEFDVDLKILRTDMPSMNDLLRAYVGVDVVAGTFSLFSELGVHGGEIRGYVKPLFDGLNVYDPKQEKGKGLLQKAKEGIVGALGQLLKSRRKEVATVADLSGPVEDPDASTLQIVANLVRNAFFQSIVPGFRREAGLREKR